MLQLDRMKQRIAVSFTIIMSLLMCGCVGLNSANLGSNFVEPNSRVVGRSVEASLSDTSAEQDEVLPGSSEAVLPSGRPNRLMVYSARYRVATSDVDEALTRFSADIEQLGGYLESRTNNQIVCRVPAAHFQKVTSSMSSLGEILEQAIQNQDVTTQHRDLGLRIQTAESSRNRVLALMERANEVEVILKLEEALHRLTEEIERGRGALKQLSEQIAYSRIEVNFQPRVQEKFTGQSSARSPFAWINQVGIEGIASSFGDRQLSDPENDLVPPTLFPDAVNIDLSSDFLVAAHTRYELKAITSDGSKLWMRKLTVSRRANLNFWGSALDNHLVKNRGYKPLGRRDVQGPDGEAGLELMYETSTRGASQRYLVTLYVEPDSIWSRRSTVRLLEFVGEADQFDQYVSSVQSAAAGEL